MAGDCNPRRKFRQRLEIYWRLYRGLCSSLSGISIECAGSMMARNESTHAYLPPLLFSVTLFTSAGLLFWIQPLVGKTLLPLLGGSPAVWNTCLLFFQSMLLIGYVYALASSRWLNLRVQAAVHVVLLLSIAVYLFLSPIHAPVLSGLQQGDPKLGVLKTLLGSIGLPFFVISASNPLLQSWFSKLQHYRSVD